MSLTTRINIPPGMWEETGSDDEDHKDPRARLLASITINGLPMHLEAFAVVEVDGIQMAADPAFQRDVEALQDMQDCAFQTVEIAGRDYILVATPHGI